MPLRRSIMLSIVLMTLNYLNNISLFHPRHLSRSLIFSPPLLPFLLVLRFLRTYKCMLIFPHPAIPVERMVGAAIDHTT